MNLSEVEGRTSEEQEDVIGSVTVGMRLELKQELKQILEIKLFPEEDNITLEMGDDLNTTKRRMAMINWVAPHEIAHLVDFAIDLKEKIFTEENQEKIEKIKKNFLEEQLPIVEEILHSAQEIVMDSIGYRMLMDYGTTNLDHKEPKERLSDAIHGFIAITEVIEQIIDKGDLYKELKGKYVLILLRQITSGNVLLNDAQKVGINLMLQKDLEEAIENLVLLMEELNAEAKIVTEEQQKEILDLYSDFFALAKQVQLKQP